MHSSCVAVLPLHNQAAGVATTTTAVFYACHCAIYGAILASLEAIGWSAALLTNRCMIGIAAFFADALTSQALHQIEASLQFEVHIDGCQYLTRAIIFHLSWYHHGLAEACYLFIARNYQPA